MIGRTLAHYQIKSALGAGGMGEVYRATDTKLGRDVAVKVLPVDMASSADRRERFQREARALAALDHPHIVTIWFRSNSPRPEICSLHRQVRPAEERVEIATAHHSTR